MDVTLILTSEFIYKYFLSSKQLKNTQILKTTVFIYIYIYIYECHMSMKKLTFKKFEIKAKKKTDKKTG